jgi:two-component system sensor histidine kinase UhpB
MTHGLRDAVVRHAESEVKRQLARELHDSVAQDLTLMVVLLEHYTLELAGQGEVVSRLKGMQGSARQALRNLREVLYDLRDQPATHRGFVPQARALLRLFQDHTGIRCQLRRSAGWPSRLPSTTAHGLYRILDEALDHVRLHASARSIEVGLATTGEHLVLEVRDDGTRPRDGAGRPVIGLIGMRERAVLLGGDLQVTNGDAAWTTVRTVIPRPRG